MTGGRIIVFAPGLSEPGGVSKRARLYATGLAERGWDVRVVARAGTLHRPSIWKRANLTVVEVPGFSHMFVGGILYLTVALTLGIVWSLQAQRLISFQLGTQTTAASVASFVTRKPCFAFNSSAGKLDELQVLLTRPAATIRRRLLDQVTAFVAQTGESAAEIRARLPGSVVHVLPTPVLQIPWYPLNGQPRALFAGRFSAEKDLMTLLSAWRASTEAVADPVLTLAGAGGSFRSVEREIRGRVEGDPHLRRSVRFTGWVDDVRPLLQDHDVFVFPSVSEGMSNSLVEACAAGRVVVLSDIPANRAVVGEAYPLLYPPGDGEALQRRLAAALSNHVIRQQARSHLRPRIERHLLSQILSEFEEITGRASRTGRQ